jgi:hypothetical protein
MGGVSGKEESPLEMQTSVPISILFQAVGFIMLYSGCFYRIGF